MRISPAVDTAAGALLIVAGVVALLTVARPVTEMVRIPSESMLPTLEIGDRVNLNRSAYRDEAPRINDVVGLYAPDGAEFGRECGVPHPRRQACPRPTPGRTTTLFIKRVVAGPGDRVAFRNGALFVNGKRRREPFVTDCGAGEGCHLPKPMTVPPGHYFTLGDNRGASDDSRWWGPVPEDWIMARAERCRALIFACSPL